jgi:hypothetical protein
MNVNTYRERPRANDRREETSDGEERVQRAHYRSLKRLLDFDGVSILTCVQEAIRESEDHDGDAKLEAALRKRWPDHRNADRGGSHDHDAP